ncbi:diguanylate cyclase [Candidatus Electronema sp. JC]|uniref:diguanylate cyclase n=1 Tax=Candidatus Electronema sp. JC TaxID=3401570 RepID=UPI003B435967
MLAGLLLWALAKEQRHLLEYARLEARANFNKDMALRAWAAKHGGVYVPAASDTPPNPYLAHLPERDVLTTSGKRLTLMNPAYMLRQVMNDFSGQYGIRGRITSLKPLNPVNAPDAWELRVLRQFEQGVTEVSEFAELDRQPYLRYMRAFRTQEDCLKCHRHQGYKQGDVRGGIGVSVPLQPYLDIRQHTERTLLASCGLLWLIGGAGLLGMNRFVRRQILRQRDTEAALLEQAAELARLNELLSHQAMYDGLTHVHNRRAFDQRLNKEWQRWILSGKVFSLLIADIDFFKSYNDACGHLEGDTCLRAVAQTLQQNAARVNDFTARYGGEEFVLILPGAGLEQALLMAEQARLAVERLALPHPASSCAKVITLSVGAAAVSQLTDTEAGCSGLLALADQALYAAKKGGRNRVAAAQ